MASILGRLITEASHHAVAFFFDRCRELAHSASRGALAVVIFVDNSDRKCLKKFHLHVLHTEGSLRRHSDRHSPYDWPVWPSGRERNCPPRISAMVAFTLRPPRRWRSDCCLSKFLPPKSALGCAPCRYSSHRGNSDRRLGRAVPSRPERFGLILNVRVPRIQPAAHHAGAGRRARAVLQRASVGGSGQPAGGRRRCGASAQ